MKCETDADTDTERDSLGRMIRRQRSRYVHKYCTVRIQEPDGWDPDVICHWSSWNYQPNYNFTLPGLVVLTLGKKGNNMSLNFSGGVNFLTCPVFTLHWVSGQLTAPLISGGALTITKKGVPPSGPTQSKKSFRVNDQSSEFIRETGQGGKKN